MSTQRSRLTLAQTAAVRAHTQQVTDAELLMLYLDASPKEREELFADTARTAEIAGLSRRTILTWIDTGVLRTVRIGKKYKVSLDSLREYLLSELDGQDQM